MPWDNRRQHSPRDCKLFGHAWYEVPSDWTPLGGGTPMQFQCDRSGCIKREIWGEMTGEVISRRYEYPEGYVYARDEERPSKGDMRLEYVLRQITEARKTRTSNGRKKVASGT